MKSGAIAARMAAAVIAATCVAQYGAMAESTTPTYVGMTEQDVGVMDRARPAYDAKGTPLGGFRLFPGLDISSSYDDNVFRTNSPLSDWFFTISPGARIKSQWGRHFFEVYGGSNTYAFTKYTAENLTDWRVGADGRYDISHAANVTASASYGQQHELWSAPNNVAGFQAAPNRSWQAHVDTSATYQPDRLGIGIGGSFDNNNWTRTPLIGGGYLNNDDRDQHEYQGYARIFYDFSPGYSGYVKASYDERDFDQLTDRSGVHRSSHGFRVDGGVNLQLTHLVRGEVFVGYLSQNFASPALKDISGFDYGVQLDWFVSDVLTAHLSGRRTLDDVVLSGVSLADNKSVYASADYEFRPNIILQAHASYTNTTYGGSTRTDNYPGAGVGVKYLVNQYASLNLNYNYSQRSTQSSAFEYTDNTVSIGLSLHI